MKRVAFRLNGEEVAISFRYEGHLVEVARGLRRRRFDPDTKEWMVPAHLCREALSAFEAAPCIVHVEPEVEALLMDPPKVRPRGGFVRLYREGRECVIDFPYDERVVRAVKSIPGRRFDPERKVWLVEMREPAETLMEILRQLRFAECEVDVDEELKRYMSH